MFLNRLPNALGMPVNVETGAPYGFQ